MARSSTAAGHALLVIGSLVILSVTLSSYTAEAATGRMTSLPTSLKIKKAPSPSLSFSNLKLRGGQADNTVVDASDQAAKDQAIRVGARKSGKDLATPQYMPWHQIPDQNWKTKDGCEVVKWDQGLEGCKGGLQYRYGKYKELKQRIIDVEGSLENFALSYKRFGVYRSEDPSKPGVYGREWAPGAQYMALMGDFNGWNRGQYPYQKDEYGVWTVFIPDGPSGCVIPHDSRYKIAITTATGEETTRIPAWAGYAVQAPKGSPTHPGYDSVWWNPPQKYEFQYELPVTPRSLRIYEAHVGMSSTGEPNINTYDLFRENVLPRIKRLGYNAIQFMAIQEHPYYASFGYHIANLFAASSRCGDPDSLKRLIDEAHAMGMSVLLDVVHSHAAKNVEDGINMFDGTPHQYFHEGPEGYHSLWDSRIFNYSSWEVLRFLLSNIRWWLEEYKFDGFRFDGVTSILYKHHGIGHCFVNGYGEYFGLGTDMDACVYLMLANDLIHTIRPGAISIAEDVSGMPTLCRPVHEGGFGFDYRLAMAAPDMWIKLLKEMTDDQWDMGYIVHTLTNRRYREKVVCYAESHDQALVGDKTIAFWLMDKEMYDGMSLLTPANSIVDRGIAMHKVIRMITMALGGEGYLTFMGNEFGHPEWIDFPRLGNDWSYHHARRMWHLADQTHLRYIHLNNFDSAMMGLEEAYPFLHEGAHEFVSLKNQGDFMIVAEKGQLLFVFNLHPTNSYQGYRIGTFWPGKYKIVLDSDWAEFGGHERNDRNTEFFSNSEHWCGRPHWIEVYAPCRTVQVYARAD